MSETGSGGCYDCAQIDRNSPAERIVKGVKCCDFHYRQRMGLPMLEKQRYPTLPPPVAPAHPIPPPDPAPEQPVAQAKVRIKEGIPMEQKCHCGRTKGHTGRHKGSTLTSLEKTPRLALNGQFTVNFKSAAALDAVWNSLPPQRKAQLLAYL